MSNPISKISDPTPVLNIIFCGVGGQGVLVASDILAEVAMNAGYDVKKSEVHGMAQRGGSVVSQVRFGRKVYSPLIARGKGDYLVAFERLETLRYLDYLKSGGLVIINNQKITPLTVFFEGVDYPENIEELCRKRTNKIITVNGMEIAETLGNPRVLNVVLLGVLSKFLEFDQSYWHEAIKNRVPPKTFAVNLKGFEQGQRLGGDKMMRG
ncbi:MAG: indolepyruvate oxidoreductase subunit beta [candidate division KSB1 bacterium]|nr:indolepyruvate oxidoreductase subunit beta [candidate division KSB1 bacterium]